MFAYGTADCAAGRPGDRARATSTSPPPSGCSRAWSASTPRPARPRSPSSPTTPPTRRYVAADLVAQAEHDPNASCLLVTPDADAARRGRPRARQGRCRRPGTASGSRPRSRGQSAYVLVDDLEQGLTVVDEWAAEHLEVVTRDAAALGRPGAQRRRGLRRPLVAGLPRRLPRRLQPRAADRRAPRGTPAGCRCSRSCAASTSWSTTATRSPRSPPHVDALGGGRGPGRPRRRRPRPGAAVTAASRGAVEEPS